MEAEQFVQCIDNTLKVYVNIFIWCVKLPISMFRLMLWKTRPFCTIYLIWLQVSSCRTDCINLWILKIKANQEHTEYGFYCIWHFLTFMRYLMKMKGLAIFKSKTSLVKFCWLYFVQFPFHMFWNSMTYNAKQQK